MSLNITSAINRVRNYLDDQNNGTDSRWSDAEIKLSLELALDVVTTEAVQAGVHQAFRQVATSSVSSGLITVLPNIKIISVFMSNGNSRVAILPAAPRNRSFIDRATAGTIEYDYIAKNNVDWASATPGTVTITYAGIDIDDNIFDAYLCCIAAMDLVVKEGEVSPVLADRTEKYRRGVLGTPITGQIQVFTGTRNQLAPTAYYQLYYYKKSQTTLEVYR